MKWWGWGSTAVSVSPSPEFRRRLQRELGEVSPASTDRIPPSLEPSRPVVLPGRLATDDATRLHYARGRSYPDLLQLRSGRTLDCVDAVAFPESTDDISAILAQKSVAVIPFGGGTSVVGGVSPRRGGHDAVVALDMSGLNRIISIDATDLTVTVQAGVFGPALESALCTRGLTLGHFPQSFEYSTVGGWIATRSAGQESTRYGRIEDLVAGLTVVTPAGRITTGRAPASASGPETRELLVGSEGVFGVITEATLRVHAVPSARRYQSYLFPSFAAGLEACRAIVQSGIHPAVLRLSDETETQLSLDLHSTSLAVQRVLSFTGRRPGAHLLLAFDGPPHEAKTAGRTARRLQGLPLGSSPGRHWSRERFMHPYLRDALMDMGYMIDTFETAASWSRLPQLYNALKTTPSGIVACHVSHGYRDGASLYFTTIDAARTGQEEGQWRAFKSAVSEAIVIHGGTISHHHSIGTDHRPWLPRERGQLAVDVLKGIKRQLDPFGIMNPEKLI